MWKHLLCWGCGPKLPINLEMGCVFDTVRWGGGATSDGRITTPWGWYPLFQLFYSPYEGCLFVRLAFCSFCGGRNSLCSPKLTLNSRLSSCLRLQSAGIVSVCAAIPSWYHIRLILICLSKQYTDPATMEADDTMPEAQCHSQTTH